MPKRGSRQFANQVALVIGVSTYPNPKWQLPAVAGDVREMGELLKSTDGAFAKTRLKIITEQKATHKNITTALKSLFEGRSADDAVFAYLAGHGAAVDDRDYFFVPYDADVSNIPNSCISLADIRTLLDRSNSQRIFLWLDFCHAGGIVNGLQHRSIEDETQIIQRGLQHSRGRGKVIVASCTAAQLASESKELGHGLFTHALLRGLRGEARSSGGEVTAMSLYDFIARELTGSGQTPIFSGTIQGMIVLMHYRERTSPATTIADLDSAYPSNTDAKVLAVLSLPSGGDVLTHLPPLVTALSEFADTDFNWLEAVGKSRFLRPLFVNRNDRQGIEIEAFPHLVSGADASHHGSTFIEFGAKDLFLYYPRGSSFPECFEITAPSMDLMCIRDLRSLSSVQVSIRADKHARTQTDRRSSDQANLAESRMVC